MFNMFGSANHEKKNPINGLVLMLVALLCTSTTFIFLHTNVTDKATKYHSANQSSHLASNQLENDTGTLISSQRAKRLPQAIIIGTRKSGTRALLKFLQVNPAARAANKEVHFFDKTQNYDRGIDWYREQMPLSGATDITIEKSPAYFVTPGVPERVKAMNSSIKLVLIFRDPVTRLISDYSQLIANKIESTKNETRDVEPILLDSQNHHESNLSGDQAKVSVWTKAEKGFEKYILRPDGGIDEQRRAIRVGMYSIYLEQWRTKFSISQFHFVDGENLIKNPYEELHKLELFLGLEPTIRPENFVFNTRKRFYCLSTEIDPVRQVNPSAENGNSGTSSQICLSRTKGRRHVAVRRELIEELHRFYAPYNEYLFSLIGKKFSWTPIK